MRTRIGSFFIFAVACALVSTPPALGQEKQVKRKDVPAAVISSFTKTYPAAVIKGFSREIEDGKTLYEVESINGKLSLDVLYNHDGSVVEVEEGIDKAALPETVRHAVDMKVGNDKISRVEKKTVGSRVTYEIGIVRKKKEVEMVVDEKGTIIEGKDSGPEETKKKPQ